MVAPNLAAAGLAGRFLPRGTMPAINTLYGAGQQGALYRPSVLGSLWQDTARTVPCTIETPVACMDDLSGNGHHAVQATTTKRPVVSRRINILLNTATLATQSVTVLATSYRLQFQGSGSVTLSGAATGVYGAGNHTITCTAGALTLTVSGVVTYADMRLATDAALPFQWINAATDYDADPDKFPTYLRTDGVDDSMQSIGNIDLSYTDKVMVCAGVTSLSNAAGQTIAELSANLNTNNGTFWLARNYDASVRSNVFASRGTKTAIAAAFAPDALESYIVTGTSNIGGNTVSVRRNGVVGTNGTSVQDQGGGNYGSYPLNLFSRNQAGFFFNGRFYGLALRGGPSTPAEIALAEYHMAREMRIAL